MKTPMNKISRNDPCPCGSGRKYKQCCMQRDQKAVAAAASALGVAPVRPSLDPVTGLSHPARDRHGIIIKTDAQIEGIRRASQLTRQVLDMVAERIGPGVSTEAIDRWVHEAITAAGATPATLGYPGGRGVPPFPASVCTSINEVVCHGIPAPDVILKDGDIVNVDVTSILDGYFGDASRMYLIGEHVSEEAKRLSMVARECLEVGIEQVRPGADFSAIGQAIEAHARKHGFSVVRDFGGHGVGLRFHEEPHVTHFATRPRGVVMQPNMVFTIEPMINVGGYRTKVLSDGWTAVTADGSLSAQWEHTIAVTETGADLLTG